MYEEQLKYNLRKPTSTETSSDTRNWGKVLPDSRTWSNIIWQTLSGQTLSDQTLSGQTLSDQTLAGKHYLVKHYLAIFININIMFVLMFC